MERSAPGGRFAPECEHGVVHGPGETDGPDRRRRCQHALHRDSVRGDVHADASLHSGQIQRECRGQRAETRDADDDDPDGVASPWRLCLVPGGDRQAEYGRSGDRQEQREPMSAVRRP
ncbi:hypothetical protein GCM10023196_046800 [Actinoallomurus vinaceus]|uniref:Uncharacterized protein n=1 Tax=Actinoallomurus vinaceus TaxID=1080074 RepID=A0ABP8UDM5_9ACTN